MLHSPRSPVSTDSPAARWANRLHLKRLRQWRQIMSNTRLTLGVALLFTLLVASIFPTPTIIFMTALLGAAPIVGSLGGRFFGRGLRLMRALPTVGSVGDEIEGRFALSNVALWPSFFARAQPGEAEGLRLQSETEYLVPFLRPGGKAHFAPRWQLARRGVWQLPPAQTGVFDPLGLFHNTAPRTEPHVITVLPRPIPIARLGFLAGSLSGSPSPQHAASVAEATDFHGIRTWQPGDSVRRVHWKSTARTGITHIIEWEETFASDITLLLDVQSAHAQTRDWFESAVTLAASIAAHVLENGHRFDLFCWQPPNGKSEAVVADEMIVAHHQSRTANGLNEALLFLARLQTLPVAPLTDLATSFGRAQHGAQSGENCAVLIASSESAWHQAANSLGNASSGATIFLLDEASYATKSAATKHDATKSKVAPISTVLPNQFSAQIRPAPSQNYRVRRASRGDSLGALLEH